MELTGVHTFIVKSVVVISVVNSGTAADLLMVYFMPTSCQSIGCILTEGHGYRSKSWSHKLWQVQES